MIRILGIDAGTANLGVAVLDLEAGSPPAVRFAETFTTCRGNRISRINEAFYLVESVALSYEPALVAIEDFIPFREDDERFSPLQRAQKGRYRRNLSQDGRDLERLIGRLYGLEAYASVVEVNPQTWPKALGIVRPKSRDFPRGSKDKAYREACESAAYRVICLHLGVKEQEAIEWWDEHARDAIGIALYAGNERILAERVERKAKSTTPG